MFSKELHCVSIKSLHKIVHWFSFQRKRQQNQSNILKAVEPYETKDWFLNFPIYIYVCICVYKWKNRVLWILFFKIKQQWLQFTKR